MTAHAAPVPQDVPEDHTSRCPTCCAPLLVRSDTTTYRPHLSWCRWAPRVRPPIVVLPVPAYLEDDDEDEGA